jgi:hypothetical protein
MLLQDGKNVCMSYNFKGPSTRICEELLEIIN